MSNNIPRVDYLQELSKPRPLSAEAERELILRWKEHGDPQARKKLIEANLRAVAKLAWKLQCYNMPLEELAAEGALGLVESIDRFDHTRGVRLLTYVSWWIRAAMMRAIINHYRRGRTGPLGRHFWKVRRACRMPVEDEMVIISKIREETGWDEADAASAFYSLKGDAPSEYLGDQAERVDEKLEREEQIRAVLEAMDKTLGVKEYIIIKSMFLGRDVSTLHEIGQSQGVTRERIRQKKVKALRKLRKYLKVA